MTAHKRGDIVLARDDSKWRVLAVEKTIVRAEHVDTGVVSHFEHDALQRLEPYPRERTP